MKSTADALFSFLRDAIYEPEYKALDVDSLPEDFRDFGKGLNYFTSCVSEMMRFAYSMSRGDLNAPMPSRNNELCSSLKAMHSSLKHLTWQTQQIAQGDYSQRVDFMGEFSIAFNAMVEQLAERERSLSEKLDEIQRKSTSLERSNLLLTTLMHYVPQQVIVIDRATREVLLMNNVAANEMHSDGNYLAHLMECLNVHNALNHECEVEFSYISGPLTRFFMCKTYLFEWDGSNAEVLAITDITVTKNRINELEVHVYKDSLTQLYNRNFGMFTLESWLHEKRRFVLVFLDLDNLKYINDEFGHSEGDLYILNASRTLQTFSPDAVVCRIGGDEFMLLMQDVSFDEAQIKMNEIYLSFQNDLYLSDKSFKYSLSFGIVAVDRDNTKTSSEVLSIADERMYENKRLGKKLRLTNK